MSGFNLDNSEITEIFKNGLRTDNTVRKIRAIFQSERTTKRIDYKPYFQREYVWDDEKATYFIESILMGTEIPPLVLFDNGTNNEVIDGRQRYQTIERFLNNRLDLKENGLKLMKSLAGKYFNGLPEEAQADFLDTKIRILQFSVPNEPELGEIKEDKIKKEIFKRYNSGITKLSKSDIERAEYISDPISTYFKDRFKEKAFFDSFATLFLSKRNSRNNERDKINIMMTKVRSLLVVSLVPTYSFARAKSKSEVHKKYYYGKIVDIPIDYLNKKVSDIISKLTAIKNSFLKFRFEQADNVLLYECLFWGLSIMYDKEIPMNEIDTMKLVYTFMDIDNNKYLWAGIKSDAQNIENIFNVTGSHYRDSIINRYRFVFNYFNKNYDVDLSLQWENKDSFDKTMDFNLASQEYAKNRLVKPDPTSSSVDDILSEIKSGRFLIRPDYQRSEVNNIQKASYLLESILLGIPIPPLFIFRRSDRISEVIDGQQRLLAILGFLGKTYLNEDGEFVMSEKHRFKLSKLKMLKELDNRNSDDVFEIDKGYEDKILDYPINIVEIDAATNPNFNNIDLFLRLNTKPFPIAPNSFEMWNAYADRKIVTKIKEISKLYSGDLFKPHDVRMKNEELITTLVYLAYRKNHEDFSAVNAIDFYVRNHRINARMRSKESITRLLDTATNIENENIFNAIKVVEHFIAKIKLLTGDDFENLPELFSHKVKTTQFKTDQNFYIAWAILDNIELDMLKSDNAILFDKIQEIYELAQAVPNEYDISEFIKRMNIVYKV